MTGEGRAPAWVAALMLSSACNVCSNNVPPPVEPGATLEISNTSTDTRTADERWGGPSGEVHRLPPLPPLEERPPTIGSPTRPVQWLAFDEPVTGPQLAAAYGVVYDTLNGMNGWFPWAETDDGWRDFVLEDGVGRTRRVACSSDLATAAIIDDLASAEQLTRGCALLQRELGGSLGPPVDAALFDETFERLVEAAQDRGTLGLRFGAPDGFDRAAVHQLVRGLGFVRSDFGTYAIYNEQEIGHDRLILLDIGVHADEPGERTNHIVLTVNLPLVPAPAHVAARMWWAAEAFAAQLGVEPIWYVIGVYEAEPVTEAAFRAELSERLQALREAGFEPTAVLANDE